MVCSSSCATITSLRARFARLGRQRDADGVADAFLQQHRRAPRSRPRCPCCPCRLRSGPGAGHSPQRAGQIAVDRDQFLHAADLARDDDARRPAGRARSRLRGRIQRRADQRLAHHPAGVPGFGARVRSRPSAARPGPGPASPSWRRCAPACHGAPRVSTIAANCASRLLPKPTLPGLIRYLASASRAGRFAGQQLVAVVVEVADDRHLDAHHLEALADPRHRGRGFRAC